MESRSRRAALQVRDRDHVKVFATTDDAGCQLRRPYFKINHKAALAVAVMAMDITMDIQS